MITVQKNTNPSDIYNKLYRVVSFLEMIIPKYDFVACHVSFPECESIIFLTQVTFLTFPRNRCSYC